MLGAAEAENPLSPAVLQGYREGGGRNDRMSEIVENRKGLRVLVLDDGMMNRRLCERMLLRLGCEVVCSGDVEEALSAAGSGPFDLVISDVNMPGTDGVSGVAQLRELVRDSSGNVPAIVAMSGQALGSDPAAYRAVGFDDYLPKPVMFDALEAGLARWVRA